MTNKWLAIILMVSVLTSCASGYQPLKGGQGYLDEPLSAIKYRVTFYDNSNNSYEEVHNYLLYRCAELALENHYPYFIILSQNTFYEDNTTVTANVVNGVTYPISTTTRSYKLTAVVELLNMNNKHKDTLDAKSIAVKLKPPSISATNTALYGLGLLAMGYGSS